MSSGGFRMCAWGSRNIRFAKYDELPILAMASIEVIFPEDRFPFTVYRVSKATPSILVKGSIVSTNPETRDNVTHNSFRLLDTPGRRESSFNCRMCWWGG